MRRQILDALKIFFGTLLAAASFRYLTFPNSIVSGGLTGIAQILNLLFQLPVGGMVIAMNVPLFLIAWKRLGKKFVISSLIAMLLDSIFIDVLAFFPLEITDDLLLAALYGGFFGGIGWGLVYTTGASGGGVDIPSILVRKKWPYMDFGKILLGINAVVIVTFAILFHKFESCMYTIICMYVSTSMVDIVAFGTINAKLCLIVSSDPEAVKSVVTEEHKWGMTFLHGQGAWSHNEKEVIMCVVKRRQLTELKNVVRAIDPSAFFIVADARSVYGKGFDDINKE